MPDSTGKTERFAEIEAAYFDAERNYSSDMANTKTAGEAKGVEQNWADAHLAWIQALNAGLAKQGPTIEGTYDKLRTANAAVRKARADSERLSKLLGKLQKASELALKLVTIAGAA